jgi:hypothetical protein
MLLFSFSCGYFSFDITKDMPRDFTVEILTKKKKHLYLFMLSRYRSSTFLRAQGVALKNFKLDFIPGSDRKQLIGTLAPISSQP